MQLHVTPNKFNPEPYWSEPIRSVFACPPKAALELFDQNGYDLTHLEQLYAVANGVPKVTHRRGQALEQLKVWSQNNEHINKLIAMKPKWGLDFSIDYCDREGNVFELLHWEYDGFDYKEIADKKAIMDEFLPKQDWDTKAKEMLERKEEWHKLGFFDQSEWKTKFFGIEKERFKMVLWN